MASERAAMNSPSKPLKAARAGGQSVFARVRDCVRNLRRRGLNPDLQRHIYWVQGRELTPVQVDTLEMMVEQPVWRVKDLAVRINVDPSQSSRIIASLVDLGLAQREQSSDDRRSARVSATDAGHAWAKEISNRLDQISKAVLDELPVKRQRLLAELLEEYMEALERVRERLERESKIPPGRRAKPTNESRS